MVYRINPAIACDSCIFASIQACADICGKKSGGISFQRTEYYDFFTQHLLKTI